MRAAHNATLLAILALTLSACAGPRPVDRATSAAEHPSAASGPGPAAAAGHALAAGDQAQDFTLPGSAGRSVHLASELGAGHSMVLVFYLGDHCQLCLDALRELEANRPAFEASGARLVAIATQSEAEAAGTAADAGASFEILADQQAEVASQYGLQRLAPGKPKDGQSPLTVFVVGPDGVVRWSGPGLVGGAVAVDEILTHLAR